MSNVFDFTKPTEPPQPPRKTPSENFEDYMLGLCAEWHGARAQQMKHWAEQDRVNLFGTKPDAVEINLSWLERMQEIEGYLIDVRPRTVRLAREMLRICLVTVAHEQVDPGSSLAKGPIAEILRNVLWSMDWKQDMRLVPKRAEKADLY